MNRTLAQARAASALARVKELETSGWSEKERDEYAGYVEQLPATILMNGLGQAAAFELAAGRKSKEHQRLYEDLQHWLCGEYGPYHQPGEKTDLMQAIVKNDRETYMRAQVEALAWLDWLKKFAVAYLKKPKEEQTP